MYFNGQETGFKIFQEVVRRLHEAYDHLIWMKLSEIARYWAARELTRMSATSPGRLEFQRLYACPQFTVKLEVDNPLGAASSRVRQKAGPNQIELRPVASLLSLKSGTVFRQERELVACFDLPKGGSARLELEQE